MTSIKQYIRKLGTFYFCPGPFVALTGAVWLYFAAASIAFIYVSGHAFYSAMLSALDLCFCYLLWAFYFYWFWGFALILFKRVWMDKEYLLAQKMVISTFLLVFHLLSMIVYFWSHENIQNLQPDSRFMDLFSFIRNPFVLGGLGILFLLLFSTRRYTPAACVWAVVGYHLIFSLLPERTGDAMRDLNTFRGIGEHSWSLPAFLGAKVVVLFGIVYLVFIRGSSSD